MKLNGVEEQLTENQRAVQTKLKKSIKAGRIPREVAKTTIDMEKYIGIIRSFPYWCHLLAETGERILAVS